MGKKKKDDEGILFYLLLALGMHLSGQNLAWKNAAAVVCSRETMVAVICFVGKLLEPTGIHGGHACWMRSGTARRVRWQGSSHAEHDKAGRRRGRKKEPSMGNNGGHAHFYAQKSLV